MADKNDRIFYFQVLLTMLIVGFSMGMIIKNPDSSTMSVFLPILSSNIAIWFQATKSIPPALLPSTTQETTLQTPSTPISQQEPIVPTETTPLVSSRLTPLQIENENNV
jgi:hypothetical protein